MIHLTQRQINTGVIALLLFGAYVLNILYLIEVSSVGIVATLIAVISATVLLLLYRRGWEPATRVTIVLACLIIAFDLSGSTLMRSFHPILLIPAVAALIMATPRWVVGIGTTAYLIVLARAGWDGIYMRDEILVGYAIIVAGLIASRLSTDTAQRLAEANQRAETERQRAETALQQSQQQAQELQVAFQMVADRETELTRILSELRTAETTVRDLSAPVIPVLPGVLVAPLVGTIDNERATLFSSNVLAAIERERARTVVLDVTGVPIIDTAVAQVLIQTSSAVRLLGARVLLVGIRPEVAQTLVALNVDLSAIATYANLQSAIQAMLKTPAASGHAYATP